MWCIGRSEGALKWQGFTPSPLGMPPLLADMIRHVLISRGDIEIVAKIGAEIATSPRLIERLQALDPDLVMSDHQRTSKRPVTQLSC